jgi:hypothetical protein
MFPRHELTTHDKPPDFSDTVVYMGNDAIPGTCEQLRTLKVVRYSDPPVNDTPLVNDMYTQFLVFLLSCIAPT